MSANAFLWLLLLFLLLGLLVAFRVYRAYIPPVQPARLHYPYALLLGCPSHDDGTMSTSQRLRCETALEAWRQGRFDTLVISGSNSEKRIRRSAGNGKMDRGGGPGSTHSRNQSP